MTLSFQVVELNESCIFDNDCKHKNKKPTTSEALIKKIIDASNTREDGFAQRKGLENREKIKVHKLCALHYCDKKYIDSYLNEKERLRVQREFQTNSPPNKRPKREPFDYKKNCFICANPCIAPDRKHPDRHRKFNVCVYTEPMQNGCTFKDNILSRCDALGDKDSRSQQVRYRIEAIIDLPSNDCRYHIDCRFDFMFSKSKQGAEYDGIRCSDLHVKKLPKNCHATLTIFFHHKRFIRSIVTFLIPMKNH